MSIRAIGERPSGPKWLERVKRMGCSEADFKPALLKRSYRTYALRVWALPDQQRPVWVADKESPNGVKEQQLMHYTTYRYRRDGKVERSWVPVPETDLIFEETV